MKEENDKVTTEEAKLIIEKNQFIQYVLKIMNGISLLDETPQDYMKLWENVSLLKKVDSIEYKPESTQFYYNLISTGYDSFGEEFMIKMSQSNPEYLVTALILFMKQLEENAKYIEQLEKTKPDSEK